MPLQRLQAAGAVTGLPSLRSGDQHTLLQTLDQVAFGIRDFSQDEDDYGFVAIADPGLLFDNPAVVNLSQISQDRDKALIISLLLMALGEYRISVYRNDPGYREAADRRELRHLAIIEEAHRLFKRTESDTSNRKKGSQRVSGKPAAPRPGNPPLVELPPLVEPPKSGLSPVAPGFNGLYGPLHKVVSGQLNGRAGYNVTRDWERRIQQSRVPFLNSAWNELVMAKTGEKCVRERTLSDQSILAVARGWHNQLTKWGVRVDLRARVRIDEEICTQYHFKSEYELGDTAIPELPYWTLGEQVVEKGLADVVRK